MRALPNLRASAVAIVTILAMLVVPACGSLCASMNHCSSSAASTEPDSCHHANMPTQSDSGALSSLASCGQQQSLLAILAASGSSTQPLKEFAPAGAFTIDDSGSAFTLADQSDKFPSSKDSPQQSTPLENLSVLRI
jgi:ABC-type phosphate transport system substrate-binding protein